MIVSGFPRLSETFILHELLELERQGLQMVIFPLKPGQGGPLPQEIACLRSKVEYVPVKLSVRALTVAGRFLLQHVRTYGWRTTLGRVSRFFISGKKERELTRLSSFWRCLYLCHQVQGMGLETLHAQFAHDPATLAYWVSQWLGIPYSFTAHAKDIYCYSADWLRQKMHHAEFVVTCTEYNRKVLSQMSQNGTPIYCLHHGIPAENFRSQRAAKVSPPQILAVGRLVEKKGFSTLLDACHLLHTRGLAFRCAIIGEGPQRLLLQRRIRRLDLTAVVQLLGALPPEEVRAHYRRATIFTLPSCITSSGDRDGLPNVILEAMAMELPVVATPVSGIPEAVEHLRTGILVPEKNAMALANALQQLLENREWCRQLGRAGRAKVLQQFTLPNNVQRKKELILQ